MNTRQRHTNAQNNKQVTRTLLWEMAGHKDSRVRLGLHYEGL